MAAHVGGFSGTHTATGWPTYFVEHHTGYTQPYQAQIVSLVYSGVFDRFPGLQFVLEEGGIGWMPSLMWRLDRAWEALREHAPHLERPPSEVIREHFWFTTQPFDEPEQPEYLAAAARAARDGRPDHVRERLSALGFRRPDAGAAEVADRRRAARPKILLGATPSALFRFAGTSRD